MSLLINAIHAAIREDKDLTSLKTNRQDLCSLNKIFIDGLSKLTLSQSLIERGNQFIKRFNPMYSNTKHFVEKERMTELLGGDVYHAAKVKGCIKNRLGSLPSTEFTRLEARCDKIRCPQHLLGVLAEIMHEGRMVPLLKEEQLKRLLSSWKGLKDVIDQGVQIFKQEVANQGIILKKKTPLKDEQLFVIQTLYDLSSENNITPEKWKSMDEGKKTKLLAILSQGIVDKYLDKRGEFERKLFEKSPNKKDLEELKSKIFESVKQNLYCLEYPSAPIN